MLKRGESLRCSSRNSGPCALSAGRGLLSGGLLSGGLLSGGLVVRGLVAGVLLTGGLVGCTTPSDSGTAQLVTAGGSPSTVASAQAPLGGVIEVGRVVFAGSRLTTSLVGDPADRQADGWTLVVGAGAFAYPRTVSPNDATSLLPVGPALRADEPIRCVTQIGSSRPPSNLPGVSVDAGDRLSIQDETASFLLPLYRVPLALSEAPSDDVFYRLIDQERLSDALPPTIGNWRPGATATLSFSGANPSGSRERGSIPLAVQVADTLTLPTTLRDVKINGSSLRVPQRDPVTGAVVDSVQDLALPGADAPMSLEWGASSTPGRITLSIEYFAAGQGRCPAGCGKTSDCCASDAECSSLESCQVRASDGLKACFPKDGSGAARLGALVCSMPDNGAATLDGGLLATLNQDVPAAEVRGAVLRLGRTLSSTVNVPDAMTADGTRQNVSPVLVRVSDVVIARLKTPGS